MGEGPGRVCIVFRSGRLKVGVLRGVVTHLGCLQACSDPARFAEVCFREGVVLIWWAQNGGSILVCDGCHDRVCDCKFDDDHGHMGSVE